jgi:hypothetical protein
MILDLPRAYRHIALERRTIDSIIDALISCAPSTYANFAALRPPPTAITRRSSRRF